MHDTPHVLLLVLVDTLYTGVVYGVVHGYCYPLLGAWHHANDLHLTPHKTSLLRSTHLVGSKANVQEEDVTYPMYKRTTCGGYTIPTTTC